MNRKSKFITGVISAVFTYLILMSLTGAGYYKNRFNHHHCSHHGEWHSRNNCKQTEENKSETIQSNRNAESASDSNQINK